MIMKNSLETKLGYFVVLAVFAAWIIVETLGGVEMFRGGYHINALFDTVQDLKVGNSVRLAGVEIGRVEKIALAGNKVRVTMKLHSDAVVRTDSKAIIKFTGLMGQYFVSIDFGTPGAQPAADGVVIRDRGTARPQRHHDQTRPGRHWHSKFRQELHARHHQQFDGPVG